MMKLSFLFLCLTILNWTPTSLSYPDGAPSSTCKSMKPEHGADVQSGQPPFEVILQSTSILGADSLNIKLSGKQGRAFKGFLVRVQKVGDDKAYGKFTPGGPESQGIPCFGNENSGITHTNRNSKNSVSFQWEAPNDADGEYEVLATFVEEGAVYWVKHAHPNKIQVKKNLQAKADTAPAAKALGSDLLAAVRDVYLGCGTSKGCFGAPGNCINEFLDNQEGATVNDICTMIVTWSTNGAAHSFQISGRASGSGYVAVGMATEKKMYPASVAGCVGQGSEPGVFRSFNPNYGNRGHENNKLGLDQTTFAKTIDGNVFCHFTQSNHHIADLNKEFNFETTNFYYLLARGTSGGQTYLGFHDSDKLAAPKAVHITSVEILSATDNKLLVKLHGAFMIFAWLLCASTGMFTARYLKQTHTTVMPFNKAFWFVIHVSCMFLTFVLTISAIVFIVVKKEGRYSEGLIGSAKWHPILGIILTALATMQVIIAFFRPHPNTPKRPLFNWVHWFIGNSAHIVGIACIFLSDLLSLSGIQDHDHFKWVLLGFVCFHIVIHLIMSLHTIWADKQMNSKVKMRAARPGPMKPSGISDEAPGTNLRTFILILYIVGVAAFSSTLVYFVDKGTKLKEEIS